MELKEMSIEELEARKAEIAEAVEAPEADIVKVTFFLPNWVVHG